MTIPSDATNPATSATKFFQARFSAAAIGFSPGALPNIATGSWTVIVRVLMAARELR